MKILDHCRLPLHSLTRHKNAHILHAGQWRILFMCALLPEPCPLDADVGNLSARRVPST